MNKQGENGIELKKCACGCSKDIPAFDKKNRPRQYIRGHRKSKGHFDKKGYRWIQIPGTGKKIQEHRFIMEKMLGRKLKPNERVHHKNEIKHDNLPSNLVLMNVVKHNHFHRPPLNIPLEIIECACGCGIKLNRYDNRGRERWYATPGHAWRKPHGRGNPNRKKVS